MEEVTYELTKKGRAQESGATETFYAGQLWILSALRRERSLNFAELAIEAQPSDDRGNMSSWNRDDFGLQLETLVERGFVKKVHGGS